MDLFGGYLLVMLVLFSVNFALLIGTFKLDNRKVFGLSLLCAFVAFALMNISVNLNAFLSFLLGYFSYIFLIMAVIIFLIMLFYLKKGDAKLSIYSILAISTISIVLLSSQSNVMLFDTILYSLFVFVVIFIVYKLSKLLVHAKRQYPVIVGEFMCLFASLVFIFALTYYSTMTLDYKMFKPFLILTPMYQLIYFIIGIAIVAVIGVLLNESKGGNS